MEPLETEAIGHIVYDPHEPTAFRLSEDRVYVRVGNKRHRILRLNTLVATGEVEIECEGVD